MTSGTNLGTTVDPRFFHRLTGELTELLEMGLTFDQAARATGIVHLPPDVVKALRVQAEGPICLSPLFTSRSKGGTK